MFKQKKVHAANVAIMQKKGLIPSGKPSDFSKVKYSRVAFTVGLSNDGAWDDAVPVVPGSPDIDAAIGVLPDNAATRVPPTYPPMVHQMTLNLNQGQVQ